VDVHTPAFNQDGILASHNVPNAEVHVLDAGHFALDTKADEIAELVSEFMKR
jgi:pimeloyl-ACP methyl ester carboxylesterase